MQLTKSDGIRLVAEMEAERELLKDGFIKVTCPTCAGKKFFTFFQDADWKKYSCDVCESAGWVWQNPPIP